MRQLAGIVAGLLLVAAAGVACSSAEISSPLTVLGVGGEEVIGGAGGDTDTVHAGSALADGGASPVSSGGGGQAGEVDVGGDSGLSGHDGGSTSAGAASVPGVGGDGSEPTAGAGGAPCVPVPKVTACSARQCGSVANGCGDKYSCGTCEESQTCTSGECVTIEACDCAKNRFACGVLVDTGCPIKVDCGECADGSVCISGLTPGRTCFVKGYAGSCDPDAGPGPNPPCGGMCDGAKPGCERPYRDCGYMYAGDGSRCPACSTVIGSWQCGPT